VSYMAVYSFLTCACVWSSLQDTVTGFILAGVGHRNAQGQNFVVIKPGRCLRPSSVSSLYTAAHSTVVMLLSGPLTRSPTWAVCRFCVASWPMCPGTHPCSSLVCIWSNAADTDIRVIEETFKDYTSREDIGIVLINQHVSYLDRAVTDHPSFFHSVPFLVFRCE
jgi:vacuolar-type H+-ATPase subunit F/Vma7